MKIFKLFKLNRIKEEIKINIKINNNLINYKKYDVDLNFNCN